MGMDVYGKNPTNETGEYFRRSVWGWRPLADLVTTLCPELTAPCQYWHSNDGAGLNGKQSQALADSLSEQITNGNVASYIKERDDAIEHMPDEPCDLCKGTGIRTDKVGRDMGQPDKMISADAKWLEKGENVPHPRAGQKGWCNGCDGRGVERPWIASYLVDEQDVREFVEFLRASGGFEIC